MAATTKLEANHTSNPKTVEAKDIADPNRVEANHAKNHVLFELKNDLSNQNPRRADKALVWFDQVDISIYEEEYEAQSIAEDLKQSGTERINLIYKYGPKEPSSSFTIKHQITTNFKTQHYAKIIKTCAANAQGIEVGEITGRYVNIPQLRTFTTPKFKRKQIPKSTIYQDIQELNDCNADGYAYARVLFGPRGKLLARHQSDKQNYRWPWGKELEKSPVLLMQLLLVEEDFRRQGVARLLMNSIIEEAKARSGKNGEKGKINFVVTFPSVVRTDFAAELKGKTEEEKEAIEKRECDNAVAFYRAFGFRRIGISKWFGFALDEEHPLRKVRVEDDLGDC